jgi:hypothetical protein
VPLKDNLFAVFRCELDDGHLHKDGREEEIMWRAVRVSHTDPKEKSLTYIIRLKLRASEARASPTIATESRHLLITENSVANYSLSYYTTRMQSL